MNNFFSLVGRHPIAFSVSALCAFVAWHFAYEFQTKVFWLHAVCRDGDFIRECADLREKASYFWWVAGLQPDTLSEVGLKAHFSIAIMTFSFAALVHFLASPRGQEFALLHIFAYVIVAAIASLIAPAIAWAAIYFLRNIAVVFGSMVIAGFGAYAIIRSLPLVWVMAEPFLRKPVYRKR